jgi:predicted RNase H-like nuclease
MIRAVGVDACPGGSLAIELVDLRFGRALIETFFKQILAAFPEATIGVDIPIGLPESGRRPPDQFARTFVGPRRSSVFFTPTRRLLEMPWGPGLGISKQAHGLGPRIRDVEQALHSGVFEVHPEVSFKAMKNGYLTFPKTSWNGFCERRGLLMAQGVELPDALPLAGVAAPDDVLDAAAAAWSAHRVAAGWSKTLPETPTEDTSGRPVAIWY